MSSSERKRLAGEAGAFRPLRYPAAGPTASDPAPADRRAENPFHFPDLGGHPASHSPAAPRLKQSLADFKPASFMPYEADGGPTDGETAAAAQQRLLALMERRRVQHEEELERLRREAEEKAAQVVADAGREAEEIRRQAAEKGYADGLERGASRIDEQVQYLAEILSRLSVVERTLVERYERQIVDLAAVIARRVVHQELTINDEALVAIARSVLAEIPLHGNVTLKLHPDDHEILAPRIAELQRDHEQLERVVLLPHEGLERGGLVLETPVGQVDASMENVFAELQAALHG
jgi:flagellar biosynthesis/type III secretory pathway protein FliH